MSGLIKTAPPLREPEVKPPPSLTFGLEIEMLVAGAMQHHDFEFNLLKPWDDPHPSDRRWVAKQLRPEERQEASQEAVKRCLELAGIPNVVRREFNPDITEISKEARKSQKALPLVDMKYHHWRVIRDGSLECEQWVDEDEVLQNYLWSDVEVASAVFKCAPPSADSWIEVSPDQKAQLERVCKVLTETLRIRISNTCGLHVHVGLGGEPIPPDTVRRFMTTMWLIEDAVLTLCAPWREGNRAVGPITQESLLALDGALEFLKERCAEVPPPHLQNMAIPHKLWDRMSTHDQRRVWVIWTLPIGQVMAATSTPHFTRGSVAIRIPDDAQEHKANTIEIRYASSTLDAKELTSWTNIFLRVFQLCHLYDWAYSAKLMNLIEGVTDALLLSKVNKAGFRTGDAHAGHELLKLLDLGNDIPLWENAQKRWVRENNHHHVWLW